MANEIYNTSWWGVALDTARTAGTNPDFFGSQFKLLTSEQDNIVVNADFSNGNTGWAGDDATLDVSNNTGKVTVNSNTEAGIKTSGVNSFTQGKEYKLTFDIVSATGGLVSGTIKEYSNSNIIGSWNGVGSYTIYFTYRSSSSQLRWLSSSSVGDILEIDNVSVQLVRCDLDQIEAKKCLADWIHTTALKDLNN